MIILAFGAGIDPIRIACVGPKGGRRADVSRGRLVKLAESYVPSKQDREKRALISARQSVSLPAQAFPVSTS